LLHKIEDNDDYLSPETNLTIYYQDLSHYFVIHNFHNSPKCQEDIH